MEDSVARRRIAVAVERSTVYGRNILRGFAEIAGTRPEWDLSLIDPRRTAATVAAEGRRFDAWICRIPDDRAAAALARTGRPVVDLAAPHNQHRFASVATDAKAIGRLAAKHLLERRYPAFAFCGYPGIGFSDRRRDAFAAALAQDGIAPAEYRPPRKFVRHFGADYRLGDRLVETPDAAALRRWLRTLPKPVAVFCSDDLRASQLVRVCLAAGFSVPRDVAVLGVDDDPIPCLFASPRLSSIDSDSTEIGRAAARALARILDAPGDAPPHILVAPRGVASRASTDCWPGAPDWLPAVLAWIEENAGRNLSACDV
ncbi:MAG: substrate-binding domain-containing protein, partial [Kiritimatiellae bacterium]|nr:substrate-binding domain-containing protein [Kiritimatiellia bacterium]